MITEKLRKFVPCTVKVELAWLQKGVVGGVGGIPIGSVVFEDTREVMVGAEGWVVENVDGPEVCDVGLFAVPSETGVNTNTWKLPTVWIRPAGTVAVSWVGLTYILAKVVPFPQRTTEQGRKLLPLTVNENDALPARIEEGESEEMDFAPVRSGPRLVTVKN